MKFESRFTPNYSPTYIRTADTKRFAESMLTCAVVLMIREPPAVPVTNRTCPVFESKTITGLIEDSGRFPGRMKFALLGA